MRTSKVFLIICASTTLSLTLQISVIGPEDYVGASDGSALFDTHRTIARLSERPGVRPGLLV